MSETGESIIPKKSYREKWTPRNFLLSAFVLVVTVAFVFQGISYITDGVGALVPYLMLIGGPVLGIFYIWYFLFYVPMQTSE